MTGRARLMLWGAILAGFVVTFMLDDVVYQSVTVANKPRLEESDWYKLARVVGFLPTWLFLAAGVILADRDRPLTNPGDGVLRRGVLIALATSLTGLAAELAKMTIGRVRPGPVIDDGLAPMKAPFAGFVDSSNLAMPSSHAAVAFAGCFAIVMVAPRWSPVVILLAAGCGLSRLLAGAHWFSDVYAAALLAYAISKAVWLLDVRNNGGRPVGWTGPARMLEVSEGNATA